LSFYRFKIKVVQWHFFIFISTTCITKCSSGFCSKFFFLSFRATFCFTNPEFSLIWISEGLLYLKLHKCRFDPRPVHFIPHWLFYHLILYSLHYWQLR
jgi:hypothetical protein